MRVRCKTMGMHRGGTHRLLKWLTTFFVLGSVGAVKQVGTLNLYDTSLPRPAGITDPMVASEFAGGGVMGNAVWAYGALRMLDSKASTHVAWSESKKSAEWHRNDVLPSPDVLYAAFGPYILDGSSEPWIYELAKQLPREARQDGGVASPSRSMPPSVLALGLGVNNAMFDRRVRHVDPTDLPSARFCERKAENANVTCPMHFNHAVEKFELSNSSRSLLDVMEAQSPGYGVRGRLTHAVIARHGYTRAHVLGCPILFINRHHRLGWRLRRRYDALVNAPPAHIRIAYNIHQTKTPVMDLAMLQLVQQNEDSFVIVQESFNLQLIHDRIQKLLGVTFPKSKVRFFYRIEDWFDALRTVDIQVGSKIHGAMASLAVETPFLLLPPDWRVQEMADAMKLPALSSCSWCQLTEWAANPTANGLVTIAASTFQAEAFDTRRQELACKNLELFHAIGLPLHPEVVPLCHQSQPGRDAP